MTPTRGQFQLRPELTSSPGRKVGELLMRSCAKLSHHSVPGGPGSGGLSAQERIDSWIQRLWEEVEVAYRDG